MEEFLYLIRLSQSDLEQTNPKQFDQEVGAATELMC